MYLENTFRNPFVDYNANTMEPEKLLSLWENPFEAYIQNISEEEFMTTRTHMVFTGGRGSGKTMLLKYFSKDAMLLRARNEDIAFCDLVFRKKYLGIYIRFDGPQLSALRGLGLEEEKWQIIFTHYFELVVAQQFIITTLDIAQEKTQKNFEDKKREDELLHEYYKLLGYKGKIVQKTTESEKCDEAFNKQDLIDRLDADINYVTHFKTDALFLKKQFAPRKTFTDGELTESITVIFQKIYTEYKDICCLLLIDEYENFADYQQKIINTYLKSYNKFAYRIGMRPYGFHTYDTITADEYIKDGRDYKNYNLENTVVDRKGNYRKFLFNLSQKRLEAVEQFKKIGRTNICDILGDKEEPEKEAIKIVKNRTDHFKYYLEDIRVEYRKKGIPLENLSKENMDRLRCPENPLLEMQNLRLLLKPNPYEFVLKAFNDYLEKKNTKEGNKYKRDYTDKYKLSYVFLLCSIYKIQSKLYYGFSDYVQLSSGVVGTYIELCRNAFQRAYYIESDSLYNGKISPEVQTQAALDVSKSEFDQIERIKDCGKDLAILTQNLGNIFHSYFVDKRIKYPETNQFTISGDLDKDNFEELYKNAMRWTIFQKKPKLQESSIGLDSTVIYTLNHIYAPTFQISARTRGGYNPKFTTSDLVEMSKKKDLRPASFSVISEGEAAEESINNLYDETVLNEGEYHQLSFKDVLKKKDS